MSKKSASILDVRGYLKHFGASHVGLITRNPGTGELVEFSAPWYHRQPINLDEGKAEYKVPHDVEIVTVAGAAVYASAEVGTGEMLIYYAHPSGEAVHLLGGASVTLMLNKVLIENND